MSEPLVWEATTLGYIRWVTDSRYRKFSPAVQKWYRPVCPNCGPRKFVETSPWAFGDSKCGLGEKDKRALDRFRGFPNVPADRL